MIVNYYEEFIQRFATILIMVPELTMIFSASNIILYISRVTVVVIIFNIIDIEEKGVQKKMTRGKIHPVTFLSGTHEFDFIF